MTTEQKRQTIALAAQFEQYDVGIVGVFRLLSESPSRDFDEAIQYAKVELERKYKGGAL